MFVVISSYRSSIQAVLPYERAHISWITEGYAAGRILVSGPRVPLNGGVLVVRGTDVAEVSAWMAGDPFVEAGVVDFEVFEFAETEPPNRSEALELFLSEAMA